LRECTNPPQLIISVVSLGFAARYLERIWGPRELIRFCIIVVVASNIIAFGFSWLSWFVLGTEDSLYVQLRNMEGAVS
jgi:hypothetical protein